MKMTEVVYKSREEAVANMGDRDWVYVEHVYSNIHPNSSWVTLYDPVDVVHKITWEPATATCGLGINCWSYDDMTGDFPQGLPLCFPRYYNVYVQFDGTPPDTITVRGIVASTAFLEKIIGAHNADPDKKTFMRTKIGMYQNLHPRYPAPANYYTRPSPPEYEVTDPPEWYPVPN